MADNHSTPKHKFSIYFYNWITYTGVILSLVIVTIEAFLFGLDILTPHAGGAYLGLITYILLPPVLILGLILIPLGAIHKRKRVLQGVADSKPQTYFFDPTRPEHRNGLYIFMLGSSIFILMTAVGSYKAFQYTESVEFCGTTCHTVMEPQHTTYQQSPHARVKCVDCHIGSGADWYVRSKMSGLRQVFRTAMKSYARPIPTPVHNLRPAKETCEQCHWPGKFYSSFELDRTYYSTEKTDSLPWNLRMLIHVGRSEKKNYGIHAHMYLDNEMMYVADDEKRQVISWVKTIGKDGKPVIYTSEDSAYKDREPPSEKVRKMDCMDCHNRPSHHFRAPFELIDSEMLEQQINPSIPSIKQKAMEALSGQYDTSEQAQDTIRRTLNEYYQNEHSSFYASHKKDIDQAIDKIVELYRLNFFPQMKARWDAYPENIGHLISPGCFRCHDGKHKSPEGKVISRDCNICHSIIEQGQEGSIEKSTEGLPFRHPFNDDESWKEMNCSDCHTGN